MTTLLRDYQKIGDARTFSEAVEILRGIPPLTKSLIHFLEFDPAQHPRGGKGTEQGGKFVKKGSTGTKTTDKPAETKPAAKLATLPPSPLAPPECVKSTEEIAAKMGGVKDRHSAGDFIQELAKRHGPAMLKVIDKMPPGTRPNVLIHAGDKEKGIPTVWLLGWSKDEGTDIHDHAGSEVGINVLRGEVTETMYVCNKNCMVDHIKESQTPGGLDAWTHSHDVRAGSTMTIPDPYIHEVFGVADAAKGPRDVTVHAYWPPLDKMNYFSKDEQGALHYDGQWDEYGPSGPKLSPQEVTGLILRAKAGGFTYDPVHHDSPKTGFSVSPYPQYEKVLKPDQVNANSIQQFLDRREEVFGKDDKAQLGAWLDPESGKVVLDIVRVVDDEQEAQKIAKEAKQAGVYDLGKGKFIEASAEGRERLTAKAGKSDFSEGNQRGRRGQDAEGSARKAWGQVRHRRPPPATFAEFDPGKHPRGQPDNKGQFGPGGGGSAKSEKSDTVPPRFMPNAKGPQFDWEKAGVTANDVAAIDAYVEEGGYTAMNDGLRQGTGCPEPCKSQVATLQKLIDDAPILAEPISVGRTVGLSDMPPDKAAALLKQFQEAAKNKGVVEFQGFSSSSTDALVPLHFGATGDILLTIDARKGIGLAHYSKEGEDEFLLGHGSKYRVVGGGEQEKMFSGAKMYHFYLEQIVDA